MAKKHIACLALLIAILIVPQAMAACSFDPRPVFRVKVSEIIQCSFLSNREQLSPDTNISEFMQLRNQPGEDACDIALSKDDAKFFIDTINQLSTGTYYFSYIHIDKQSNFSYENFLQNTYKANADSCDCKKYSNINRSGGWTAYIVEEDCPHDDSCRAVPPAACLSRKFYDLTSNFVLMAVIIAAGVVSIFMMLNSFFRD